jgi:hypothetical protein
MSSAHSCRGARRDAVARTGLQGRARVSRSQSAPHADGLEVCGRRGTLDGGRRRPGKRRARACVHLRARLGWAWALVRAPSASAPVKTHLDRRPAVRWPGGLGRRLRATGQSYCGWRARGCTMGGCTIAVSGAPAPAVWSPAGPLQSGRSLRSGPILRCRLCRPAVSRWSVCRPAAVIPTSRA